jgi:hypothetical membrane protein
LLIYAYAAEMPHHIFVCLRLYFLSFLTYTTYAFHCQLDNDVVGALTFTLILVDRCWCRVFGSKNYGTPT